MVAVKSSDPRVFFASERTLLAWVRTGIAIVGLGFIVSRFGLFLHLVSAQAPGRTVRYDAAASSLLGVTFAVIGGVAIAAATWQHGRFIATLPETDRPTAYTRTWALWLSGLVSLASLLLASYPCPHLVMRPNKSWKPCLVFTGLLLLAVCAGVGAPPASAAGPAQTQTRPLLRVATGRIAPFVFKQGQQLTGFSIDVWNALAQGSPLRKPINEALLKLYEDGKYEEIHKKWFSQGR